MKNQKILAIGLSSLIILAGLTGCVTTDPNNPDKKIDAAIGYVKPAVRLACVIAIEESVDEAERESVAKQIYDTSLLVESLSDGDFPTVQELKNILEQKLPNDRKYIVLILSLSDVYNSVVEQLNGKIESEKSKIAIKYLHEIAAGCREAAEFYIKK